MGEPVILLLAAGASSRMRGGDKLLEVVGGEPMLRRQARTAVATGCAVVVVVPPDRPGRVAAVEGLGVVICVAWDAAQGMAASIRAGLAAAEVRDCGVMILPADMPEIGAAELAVMIGAARAAPDTIVRGMAEDGTPGHPVLFPPDLWDALAAMKGDQGGRAVIRAYADRVRLVALPGRAAVTDLDTPEDWAAWRAGQGGRVTD